MASAWIRWRQNKDGVRLATLQWRDAHERIHSQALGTSDERVARVYLDSKRRDLGKPRRRSRTASQSLEDAVEGFLAEKAMACRPATVGQYRQRLRWLFETWADVRQSQWNRALYVAFLEGRGWSPRSRQLQTAICRQFIEWAHEASYPVPDFVGGYRAPRIYRKKPTTLSAEEVDRLLEAARGNDIEPAVALAVLGGLRHAEIRAACWDDVDFDEGMLTIRGTKSHRDRVIPMSGRLADVLGRHRGARREIVRSTCTVKSLKALCRRAGVPEVSWHPLRHTCGTLLARQGCSAPTIRDWLGHASISTTNVYVHTNREDLRKAAEALG